MIPTTTGGLMHLTRLMPTLRQEIDNYKDAEIIIVENNSKDGTTNYLANYACTIKVNITNVGFAKAHNQAAKIAQGKYLLLLNNDTAMGKNALAEMVKVLESDPKIGIVGCAIYTMDLPKRIMHAGVYFTEDYVPYELGLPVAGFSPGITNNDDRVSSVREVPSVTAACMLVRKSVWDEVGGLDEGYINGWEDTDFVLKAREKGYKVFYTGKAFVNHKKFGTYGRFKFEQENRAHYDSVWLTTGRAKKILGDFREG